MSIRKRGNRYQVTYRVPGEATPRTETFKSEDEALIRDAQIRLAKQNGTFEPPVRQAKGKIAPKTDITVKEFMDEYVEVYGLKKWGNVHIDGPYSAAGEAHLKIDRELRRCSNESIAALEKVNRSTIIFKFPQVMPKKATTSLVLKAPKTESSNRTIYLPQAVIDELRTVKAQQEQCKAMLGEEYKDYDLVIAQINGRPYEQRIIDKMFYKLIEENSLRPVVFHSLRHSSTSLKLKLSKGNIKAVQGDTGHAEARMVTDTYAHGFDADRKLIAQEMDSGFFSKVGADQKPAEADSATVDLLKQLVRQHPDLLTELLKEANGEQK